MNTRELKEILDSRTISTDLILSMVGKKIGSGSARNVYECLLDPSLVIKIEVGAGSFQNIQEYNFWIDVEMNKEINKWLAPCTYISDCGTVLLQKKVLPIRESELPKQLPFFLTDLKVDNFGMLGKKIVCCDYALIVRDVSTRMRKADWFK